MIETEVRDTSHDGIGTLDRNRSEKAVRKGRTWRWVGTALLGLFILAGAVGLLGVHSGTSHASANGVALDVEYPAITRAGLSAPFRVEVRQAEPFDGPITIAVSRQLFDRFDFQNFYPNPSKETSDNEFVEYEFDEPDGNEFVWNFDVRAAPNQVLSWSSYTTQVRDSAGAVLVETDTRIVVLP